MKDTFLNNSVKFIQKYNKYNENQVELIKYGLEGLYLTITKLFILIIVSLLLNIFKEIIFVILFFNIIRFFAFGAHADKSSICLIASLTLIIGLTFIIFNTNINQILKIIICIVCVIDYLAFAPADTKKRPLTNKKKRIIRKMFSVFVSIIYTILIITVNNSLITNSLFISLIIEALMINPIMYKLIGVPFNNYKKTV